MSYNKEKEVYMQKIIKGFVIILFINIFLVGYAEVKHSPELDRKIAEYESTLNSIEMYTQKSCKDVELRNGSRYVFYDERGKCHILEGGSKHAPAQTQIIQGPFLYFGN